MKLETNMKTTIQTRQMMLERISVALAYNKIDIDQVKTDSHMWQLWHWVHQETAYDDSHPRFNSHPRQFAYDPSFQLYPDGTNDNSIKTALVWCLKQLRESKLQGVA